MDNVPFNTFRPLSLSDYPKRIRHGAKVSEKKTMLPNLVYSLFTSTALYLDYGT